jgi:hypothetical protein
MAMVVMPILGKVTMSTCFEDIVAHFYDNLIALCDAHRHEPSHMWNRDEFIYLTQDGCN